ncbi:snaclec 1-like [Mya arenaria]|uniref:snaclec 1-like n=1 Tax=Mya arenaria TaxID=6604 RepID=UPI0022E126F7|nr:snaclec 1-like [Mya arenaria]
MDIGVVLVVCSIYFVESVALCPAGCENGWSFHDDFCYQVIHAHAHFEAAKAICEVKGAELTSLWLPLEVEFVLEQLNQLNLTKPSAWIGVGVARGNKWVWLDGSGSLDQDLELPGVDEDLCATLTHTGSVAFLDCDDMLDAFVCKTPIHKIYVPDEMNISDNGIYLRKNPGQTIFERLWPPIVDVINMEISTATYHLATIDVAHETDCAYRCYTIDECRAFIVTCKSSRKCNVRLCELMAGLAKLQL